MKMERTIGGNRNRGCYFSLACSIGSFSIACGSLFSINAYNEKISLQRGIFLTSLGFIYFISLTDFFNKYFLETSSGQRFRQKYRLMMSDVLDITNKTVSTIQAALSCIAGFIICNSSCRKSFLTASHFMSDAYAWFGTAYFIYDIWAMYKVHVQKISDKLKLTKGLPSNMNNNNNNNNNNHLNSNNNNQTYSKLNVLSQSNGNGKLIPRKIQQNGNNTIEKISINNNGIDKVFINDRDREDDRQFVNDIDSSSMKNAEESTTTTTTTTTNGSKLKYNKKMNNNYNNLGNNTKGIEEKISFLKYCITHPIMIIHHLFLGSFGLLVIVYLRGAFGDCVYGFIYLMEFSTPYVSIRSILSTMGLKKSRIYIVNGLIMVGTFFVCRILMWPFVYYWYSQLTNMTILQAIASLPSCCKIGTLILFLPQIYWFYLMVRGAIKVFFPPKTNSISNGGKNKNNSNNHNKKTDKTTKQIIDRINNNNNNNNNTNTNSKITNGNKVKSRKDIQNRNLK